MTTELVLRIPFPSGSLAYVRGTGLTHSTTNHAGVDGHLSQRKTLVMMNHELVRPAVHHKIKEQTGGKSQGPEMINGAAE